MNEKLPPLPADPEYGSLREQLRAAYENGIKEGMRRAPAAPADPVTVERVMELAREYRGRWRSEIEELEQAEATLRAEVERLVQSVAFWKADSAAAWDRCEERRIEAERAERENATLRGVLDRVHIRQEGENSALERAELQLTAAHQLQREHTAQLLEATGQRDEALALLRGLQGWLNDGRWDAWRYIEGVCVYKDRREWLARIDAFTRRKG